MMYIIYNHMTIYVNIALLKSRIKSICIWILKASRTASVIMGIFLLLGTAGSSDLEMISSSEIMYNIFVSFLLFGVAYILEFLRVMAK